MNIKYLSHTTSFDNLKNAIQSKYLYTTYERYLEDISFEYLNKNDETKRSNKGYDLHEFPGIFMCWHTGKNSVFGNIVLIYSGEILKRQKNYHINLVDRNGFFTETITYFPEDIDNIPIKKAHEFWNNIEKKCKTYFSYNYNELIFHDKIHIDLISSIWFKERKQLIEAKKTFPKNISDKCKMFPSNIDIDVKIPKNGIDKLNTTSEAIRVFSSDNKYTGIKIPLYLPNNKNMRYKSSLRYVKNIAKQAGVSSDILQNLHSINEVETYLEREGYYHKAITQRHR